jgi:hypothetical protein
VEDQSRDAPNSGAADADVPLKRDRQRLRNRDLLQPSLPEHTTAAPPAPVSPKSTTPPLATPANPVAPESAVTETATSHPVEPESVVPQSARLFSPPPAVIHSEHANARPFRAASSSDASPASGSGSVAPPSARTFRPAVRPPLPEGLPTAPARLTGRDAAPDVDGAASEPPELAHPLLGPLTPHVPESPPNINRLGWVAIIAAVVLPPVGLVLGIVATNRGKAVRGWPSDKARAAIVVSIIMTVFFAVMAAVMGFAAAQRAEASAALDTEIQAHASVVATCPPSCQALVAHPGMHHAADAHYGSPTLDAPEGLVAGNHSDTTARTGFAAVATAGHTTPAAAASQRPTVPVATASAVVAKTDALELLRFAEVPRSGTVDTRVMEY